ncbi:MAG: hypothetical protein IJ336_01575 [Lachnospiraceae bacterium]|nr:hypothetical protein [Lachnospiraceae bacterium]
MNFIKKLPVNYIIAAVISLLLFIFTAITCYYTDLRSLTTWTINLWDAWYFTGNPFNFYVYSAQNLHGLDHAMVGSDILIYIPWAIWNLPIWALQRFGNMPVLEHPLMLFYSKLFLIVLLALSCILIYRIGKLITEDMDALSKNIVLYASSFFVLTGIAYVGQNDILVIFVFLLALYNLLKGKEKAFMVFAALSVALKPFFIFSYIAIVLYKEKKLYKAILYLLAGVSIYVLQKVPFLVFDVPMYQESLNYGPTTNVLGTLLQSSLNISPVGISVFVLALLAVYFMAYLDTAQESKNERILYYCTLPLLCFCAFSNYESYRPIYLCSIFFLLMLGKPAYRRINLWLETVFSGALIAFYLVNDYLFYNNLYIHLPANSPEYDAPYTFLANHLPNAGLKAFTALAVFTLVIMAVINHPNFKSKNEVLCMKEEKYLVILRSILYALPFLFAVVLKCVI